MQFGFYTPNFDYCGDARVLADFVAEAEAAGWDGFFIWDHLQVVEPTADPWVALTAMALRTHTIRVGTLVTPLPRRHIAKLAREVLTLDHLSGGRVVLGTGAGYPHLPDYTSFGDKLDQKTRAAKFDEGLEVLAALWSGEPVQYSGEHYQVDCGAFQPAVQRPPVPVWVAASWPARKPVRRAARWDGMVVAGAFGLEVKPDDLHEAVTYVKGQRGDVENFDIIRFGRTADSRDTAVVKECASAGATWWVEYVMTGDSTLEQTRARIRQGPPRP